MLMENIKFYLLRTKNYVLRWAGSNIKFIFESQKSQIDKRTVTGAYFVSLTGFLLIRVQPLIIYW